MSIFPKKTINAGDLVIGIGKYGWTKKGAPTLARFFDEPSLVLEIKDSQALVYLEQQGPRWYDITKLERVYVKEEFGEGLRPGLADDWVDNSDKSRNKNNE